MKSSQSWFLFHTVLFSCIECIHSLTHVAGGLFSFGCHSPQSWNCQHVACWFVTLHLNAAVCTVACPKLFSQQSLPTQECLDRSTYLWDWNNNNSTAAHLVCSLMRNSLGAWMSLPRRATTCQLLKALLCFGSMYLHLVPECHQLPGCAP